MRGSSARVSGGGGGCVMFIGVKGGRTDENAVVWAGEEVAFRFGEGGGGGGGGGLRHVGVGT